MKTLAPSAHVDDTHLKSHLDVIFDQAKSRAVDHIKLLDEAIENGEDISQKDREFREREYAHLNNMGKLQIRLEAYRNKNKAKTTNAAKEKEMETSKSDNSTTLGLHLRAAGEFRHNRHFQAHHIICSKHPGHAASRLILFLNKMEIGINDPDNGCWLPTKHKYAIGTPTPKAVGHRYVHTDDYARWVHGFVKRGEGSKQSLQLQLDMLKTFLLELDEPTAKKFLTEKGLTDLRIYT